MHGYYMFTGIRYGWAQAKTPIIIYGGKKAINFNVGLDFELLKSKITESLNYYVWNQIPLLWILLCTLILSPNIQGSTYANVATFKNSGLEIQVNANAISSKNLLITFLLQVHIQHN